MKNTMKIKALLAVLLLAAGCGQASMELTDFPEVREKASRGAFPLAASSAATICVDSGDARVVSIAAGLLADDVERLTGLRPAMLSELPEDGPALIAGTVGQSRLIDSLSDKGLIDTEALHGKWESYVVQTIHVDERPMLVVAGSDRRGTAFGLTSLCEAAGVSPWHWWADVTPARRKALHVQPGRFLQDEPDVQYRGIFIPSSPVSISASAETSSSESSSAASS